jgi:[acyl-carrier-protein] S-malonyltransferase
MTAPNKSQIAMFPGQGSQKIGMGKALLEQFSYVKDIFEEAEDACSLSIRSLCFEGPEATLQQTSNLQPCLLTVSMAVWSVLTRESDYSPYYYAGHSLGEYSALCASGRMPLALAVSLVHRRGLAMEQACPKEIKAGMAAVLGANGDELQGLCSQLLAGTPLVCDVANWNSPTQHILSGHFEAIEKITGELEKLGIKSKILPVSAPFHSRLMVRAREEMTPPLQGIVFSQNDMKNQIIPNLTGLTSSEYIPDYLIHQIDRPVLWEKSLLTAYENGVRSYLEVGPGRVLFGLARQTLPKDITINHTNELKDILALIS